MAEEAPTTPAVDAPAVPASTAEPSEPAQINGSATAVLEEKTDGGVGESSVEESNALKEQASEAPQDAAAPTTEATPGSKDKKRKSTGGVPEHKVKKLNKKKSMPTLHLECKPGQFYWARLKGYPPWPSVICDESMLPDSLLATRPVSTARPDGTIREDFLEGGKNAKERTFPIMFLSTNEFQWMINTALTPLEPEECNTMPSTKMTKALQHAYQIASEDHDLDYFKNILVQWQEENDAVQKAEAAANAEAERLAAEKAEEAVTENKEKPKKKAARKSKGADEDEEMGDSEAPKSSKKRKKDAAESDADALQPKKTPKVTKLNAPKTPNGDQSTAKKSKPKKKVVTAPKMEEENEAPVPMNEEERAALRKNTILFYRHRLQKGFLTRDKAPEESEMADMNKYLSSLEGHQDLEAAIIKDTKIHKVLKGIVKLASIPRDEEFQFKKRSSALLEIWNKRIDAAGDVPATSADAENKKPPEANGETAADATAKAKPDAEDVNVTETTNKEIETKAEKAEEEISEKTDAAAPLDAPAAESVEVEKAVEAADGDVSMED